MSRLGIELHDSTIEALSVEDADLVLNCVVYVHEPGDPGLPAGTGRFHDAVIRVKDFECDREEFEFPLLLDGGSLVLNGRRFDGILPYPLAEEGETALLLEPGASSEFLIRGAGIEIELLDPQGKPEAFPGAS